MQLMLNEAPKDIKNNSLQTFLSVELVSKIKHLGFHIYYKQYFTPEYYRILLPEFYTRNNILHQISTRKI